MSMTLVRRATEGLHQDPLSGRTTSVLDTLAEDLARTVPVVVPTEVLGQRPRMNVQFVLRRVEDMLREAREPVARSVTDAVAPVEPVLELDMRPGAPSSQVLLGAVRDLRQWTALTQEQLCGFLGISPSTVMAWRRELTVHPRHKQIPTLVRLWAALAAARDELGEDAATRLLWQLGELGAGGLPGLPADELAERLLVAADEASRAAFDDEYDPTVAQSESVEELEAGERTLREALGATDADRGGADDE